MPKILTAGKTAGGHMNYKEAIQKVLEGLNEQLNLISFTERERRNKEKLIKLLEDEFKDNEKYLKNRRLNNDYI